MDQNEIITILAKFSAIAQSYNIKDSVTLADSNGDRIVVSRRRKIGIGVLIYH